MMVKKTCEMSVYGWVRLISITYNRYEHHQIIPPERSEQTSPDKHPQTECEPSRDEEEDSDSNLDGCFRPCFGVAVGGGHLDMGLSAKVSSCDVWSSVFWHTQDGLLQPAHLRSKSNENRKVILQVGSITRSEVTD